MIQPIGVLGAGASLAVYVHFPFCLAKCGYCDFASVAAVDIPHQAYAGKVLQELAHRAAEYAGPKLRTLYFGGGTPSLWQPASLAAVLREVQRALAPAAAALEVTLEANPGTASPQALAAWREAGITRLSLGVQSLDDSYLRLLSRIHSAAQARQVVREARAAGFDNLSLDLMVGLPGQTLAHHAEQLEQLLELEPDHVSVYALTLTPRSPLARAGQLPAADDLQAEMMELTRERLQRAGLPQYEVSNFAAARRRSLHNALVWAGQPYLGLGASASSMRFVGGTTLRQENPAWPRYLDAPLTRGPSGAQLQGATPELLAPPQATHELVFLALRTTDGLSREAYRARFGEDPEARYGPALETLCRQGLLVLDEQRIAPTARGLWFADEIALRLLA